MRWSPLPSPREACTSRWLTYKCLAVDHSNTALIALGIGLLVVGACISWLLGSQLVKPVNRPVPCQPASPAQVVSLPGPGHASRLVA